jgi:hypothetical protein
MWTTLGQIGIPVIGAGVGFLVGVLVGWREGGDINIAPAIYGPVGAVIGGGAGVVAAAVIF